jgi:hypothetical protein
MSHNVYFTAPRWLKRLKPLIWPFLIKFLIFQFSSFFSLTSQPSSRRIEPCLRLNKTFGYNPIKTELKLGESKRFFGLFVVRLARNTQVNVLSRRLLLRRQEIQYGLEIIHLLPYLAARIHNQAVALVGLHRQI